jgi:hypothetical protein
MQPFKIHFFEGLFYVHILLSEWVHAEIECPFLYFKYKKTYHFDVGRYSHERFI